MVVSSSGAKEAIYEYFIGIPIDFYRDNNQKLITEGVSTSDQVLIFYKILFILFILNFFFNFILSRFNR